ncbi:baseplate spike [Vibrio phage K460]
MNKSPIVYNFLSTPLSQSLQERNLTPTVADYKSLPATITGIQDYESHQCLDVRVAIDDVYVNRNDYVSEGIELKKKFVSLLNSGGFSIKQPVSVGDPVKLCWSNKSLGQYLDGEGGNVEVNVKEVAELDDCWVELVGGTRKNNTKPSTVNFIIEGPKTTTTITPEGDVTTVTSGSVSVTAEGSSYLKSSKHTIDTDVEITGQLNVRKASYHHAGMFASTYTGITGGAASFEVDVNVNSTFSINGVAVNGHDHNDSVPPFPN